MTTIYSENFNNCVQSKGGTPGTLFLNLVYVTRLNFNSGFSILRQYILTLFIQYLTGYLLYLYISLIMNNPIPDISFLDAPQVAPEPKPLATSVVLTPRSDPITADTDISPLLPDPITADTAVDPRIETLPEGPNNRPRSRLDPRNLIDDFMVVHNELGGKTFLKAQLEQYPKEYIQLYKAAMPKNIDVQAEGLGIQIAIIDTYAHDSEDPYTQEQQEEIVEATFTTIESGTDPETSKPIN